MLNNIINRIKLHFRKEKELYLSLYEILGFYPNHIDYYKLALMHKSVTRRNEKGRPLNNERLEFLGDAVLGAIVGDIVYKHFPGKREGFLTNTRSKIVQRATLNKLSNETGFSKLIMTNGKRNGSHNNYVGGNAFEALIGAIYLDQGYRACKKFVEKRILGELINIDKVAYKEINFKSKLIEWGQKNRIEVVFQLVDQKKDEKSNPIFHFEVLLDGVKGCDGEGFSKKESQQRAAKETLAMLKKSPEFIDKVFVAKAQKAAAEESALSVSEDQEEPLSDDNVSELIAEHQKQSDAPDGTNAAQQTPDNEKEDIISAAEAAAFATE